MPGVVISVAPSGMPAGCLDRAASGDVAPMPVGGVPCEMTCPETGIGHAVPIINDASRKAIAVMRNIACRALVLKRSCSRICRAPAKLS